MIEVRVPELAESITEATIVRWAKSSGERVTQGDVLVELETDKVNMEVSAEHEGVLAEILRVEGTVLVGEVIAMLETGVQVTTGESTVDTVEATALTDLPTKEKEPTVQENVKIIQEDDHKNIVASPAARRLARERNLPLRQIKSSDPLGRVYVEDVLSPNSEASKGTESSFKPLESDRIPEQQEQFNGKEPSEKLVEHVPMSKRRQTIANRLVDAQHQAAMLTTFNEVDMSAILALRKRRGEAFLKQHDVKLGFMSFFTKAVVRALKQYPMVNAEIRGNEFLMKKYYDIGIAVAADQGLVVPVVRNADRLNFAELEQEIASLANKARQNNLRLTDLQGGTFTITNGGTFGSLMSTPILNAPQVGILGMHKIQWRPIAINEEEMENRPMMYIALSYDHRIIDGKEAVGFLVKVKELLEDPETLLLEA